MPPFSHLTSWTPTKSNLQFPNSLATYTFNVPNLMSLFHCLGRTKGSGQAQGTCICFITRTVLYSEEFLVPCLTPMLEDHHLLAVCKSLFNKFAFTLHFGGHSSIRNLTTQHEMVRGTHLPCQAYTQTFGNFNYKLPLQILNWALLT